MVFQFKIQILGITKPPVWRKIAVPSSFTFFKFHKVIQAAFGWEDYHMFEFKDKEYRSNICISAPLEDDLFDSIFFEDMQDDASKIKLSEIFTSSGQNLLYVYDFGDEWVHKITLESITDDKKKKAVCLSGKGACPPEDCGGTYGYEDIKNVFKTDPTGDQADEYREWLGLDEEDVWDADAFNIDETNVYLKDI
ncbi:MAG: plasmid pRiA4b ORF-3 family protein [Prevotella sp.]|jgi:hypothetical protein|nr:plasmid pRiA4b ORF-3 family protein [Prevotella sp.]